MANALKPDFRGLARTTAGYWALSLVLLLVFARAQLQTDFWFDEAWRADVIRSSNPFVTARNVKAPIPPLWPALLHLSDSVVSVRFLGLRVQSLCLGAFYPALVGQFVRVVAARSPRRSTVVGMLATIATCLSIHALGTDGYQGMDMYLNDYLFQAALVVLFLLIWLGIDREWLRPAAVVGPMLLLSVGTMSGLFVLPAAAVWAYRSRRRLPLFHFACALGASGAIVATLYLTLYRQQVDETLRRYWAFSVFRNGSSSIVGTATAFVESAGRIVSVTSAIPSSILLIGGLTFLALAIVGFRRLRTLWAVFPVVGLSAMAMAIVASVIIAWPATFVRVNQPFLSVWVISAILGLEHVVQSTRFRRIAQSTVLTLLGCGVAAGVLLNQGSGAHLFARGLDADLQLIRDSPSTDVVVVGYHYLVMPFLHDGLINESPDPTRYDIRFEPAGRPGWVDDAQRYLLSRPLTPETEIWCIIPFDVGPDLAAESCQLSPELFEQTLNVRGHRALIYRFRLVASV